MRSNCNNCKPKATANNVATDEFTEEEFYRAGTNIRSKPMLPVQIYGLKGRVCADTGASRSVMGNNLYEKLKDKCHFETEDMMVKLADGSACTSSVLTTTVDVTLQEKVFSTNFIVLGNDFDNPTLLGADFIEKAGIVLALSAKSWYFKDQPDKPHTFEVNAATMQTCSKLREEGTMLTSQQKQQLCELLDRHPAIFQPGGVPTDFAEHAINTEPGQTPISTPPYRLPPQRREQLKKEIDKLLQDDVIEECESPWTSNVVLVPKKDGQVRLCVDYRPLNAVTIADKYPMPRIDELLHSAKQTKYMTTLDLRAGYYQVRVRDVDRDKTAFTTPFGIYRFKRMSFGLKNAPSTFQRLIDRFRAGVIGVTIFAYLDDLIILSETFDKHLTDLETVFQRLELFKLRVNREKSVFACAEVRYLGHIITTNGIQTDPAKTAAIADLPEPRNVKHLKSFVQTCAWYRLCRLCRDFRKWRDL